MISQNPFIDTYFSHDIKMNKNDLCKIRNVTEETRPKRDVEDGDPRRNIDHGGQESPIQEQYISESRLTMTKMETGKLMS